MLVVLMLNDKVVEDDGSTRVTLETQKVAKLINPEKNTSLFKLPKSVIKTLLTAQTLVQLIHNIQFVDNLLDQQTHLVQ
jgi:hypothetical protein